jgi:hypothetical protein
MVIVKEVPHVRHVPALDSVEWIGLGLQMWKDRENVHRPADPCF